MGFIELYGFLLLRLATLGFGGRVLVVALVLALLILFVLLVLLVFLVLLILLILLLLVFLFRFAIEVHLGGGRGRGDFLDALMRDGGGSAGDLDVRVAVLAGEIDVGVEPLLGSLLVGLTELVELLGGDHLLLLKSMRTETPRLGIHVTIHNDTLDLGNNTVIASGHDGGGHLSDGESNGLTLGGHDDNKVVDIDAVVEAQETGHHELSTEADGANGAILDDDTLVVGQEVLERADDTAQIDLILLVIELPLSVQNVVHGDHTDVFNDRTGADTTELLHVTTSSNNETQVDAEGTDVSSGLAGDVEDSQVALGVVLQHG